MKRRSFLGAMLAACAAPAIVTRPGALMQIKAPRIWVPATPRLVIYSGLPGAGVQLAALALPADWMSDALGGRSTGVVNANMPVENSGDASHFRILNAKGEYMIHGDMSDLTMDNPSVHQGQTLSLQNFQLKFSA